MLTRIPECTDVKVLEINLCQGVCLPKAQGSRPFTTPPLGKGQGHGEILDMGQEFWEFVHNV